MAFAAAVTAATSMAYGAMAATPMMTPFIMAFAMAAAVVVVAMPVTAVRGVKIALGMVVIGGIIIREAGVVGEVISAVGVVIRVVSIRITIAAIGGAGGQNEGQRQEEEKAGPPDLVLPAVLPGASRRPRRRRWPWMVANISHGRCLLKKNIRLEKKFARREGRLWISNLGRRLWENAPGVYP